MSCIDFDSICSYFTTTYIKYTTSFSTITDFPCKDDVTFNEFYCFKLDDLKLEVKNYFSSTPLSADIFIFFKNYILLVEFKNPWQDAFVESIDKFSHKIAVHKLSTQINEVFVKKFKLRGIIADSIKIIEKIISQKISGEFIRVIFIFSIRKDFLKNIPHLRLRGFNPDSQFAFLRKVRQKMIKEAQKLLNEIKTNLDINSCESMNCEDFKIFLMTHREHILCPKLTGKNEEK